MASILDFGKVKRLVEAHFKQMQASDKLFTSKAAPDDLYQTYLSSFPEGTNPIFRERAEHDCSACRSFIRQAGGVLAIINGKLVSIWDVETGDDYQPVVDALSNLAKSAGIDTVFYHYMNAIGTDYHIENVDGKSIRWEHFYQKLDRKFVQPKDKIGSLTGAARTNYETLGRSLREITSESISLVRDLIAQNTLYRGQEHTRTIDTLVRVKADYEKAADKDIFLWMKSGEIGAASAFRNTVIGTLLTDLSEGVDLEVAVSRFESKVAPQNYKRPTALITQKMIKEAEAKVLELGLEESLHRRYATIDDININNVLFASRQTIQLMGAFDQLAATTSDSVPAMDKLTAIPIADFIANVIPTAQKIEVFLEARLQSNLVSLIAPVNKDAPNLMKWGNNFSWSYIGEVTDSIKERVKQAGGSVTGFMRASLSWHNYDDLDLYVTVPNGGRIYFAKRTCRTTLGFLDVDANAGGGGTRTPVENIAWPQKDKMEVGKYTVSVNCWARRESQDTGFTVQLENEGRTWEYTHDKNPVTGKTIDVVSFEVSANREISIVGSTDQKYSSREMWGVTSGKFIETTTIMYSPNHWDGENTGNQHVFFMLKDCINPEAARGFYNEFLKNELDPHRKVFEHLASVLKTLPSEQQLSGLGFSLTKPDYLVCRVTGTFTRTMKVVF